MPNKMLIDATHPEETRVVVLRGHRVEEFDFESASRKQLRGNIYLAKVTRVEPSLQAAFVDYGGNRHGFLAFSEIHPDYYQIPIADRQALIAEEERAQRAAEAEADHRAGRRNGHRASRRMRDEIKSERIAEEEDAGAMAAASEQMVAEAGTAEGLVPDAGASIDAEPFSPSPAVGEWPTAFPSETSAPERREQSQLSELSSVAQPDLHGGDEPSPVEPDAGNEHAVPVQAEHHDSADHAREHASEQPEHAHGEVPHGNHADAHEDAGPEHALPEHALPEQAGHAPAEHEDTDLSGNVTEVNGNGGEGDEESVESVGGADAMEEVPERMPRLRRQYKIQEVIKRRQVMLVQVVKEERGTKGAALTTYLSLAGRYSVLMPNTARGGGISRKITSAEDRRRLKEIAQELEVPEGMGVILRTAGAARTKTEVKRDFEYLLRLWETVRDLTLKSTAPMLVYEEGSLVKRSIRDLYNKDIDEI
ncbi:MAG: ribonuclease E/G, partial [Hyphomicrobiales bacterium]|nr:ribonuclease E/G [Hyphomicrobiales bacterium]